MIHACTQLDATRRHSTPLDAQGRWGRPDKQPRVVARERACVLASLHHTRLLQSSPFAILPVGSLMTTDPAVLPSHAAGVLTPAATAALPYYARRTCTCSFRSPNPAPAWPSTAARPHGAPPSASRPVTRHSSLVARRSVLPWAVGILRTARVHFARPVGDRFGSCTGLSLDARARDKAPKRLTN